MAWRRRGSCSVGLPVGVHNLREGLYRSASSSSAHCYMVTQCSADSSFLRGYLASSLSSTPRNVIRSMSTASTFHRLRSVPLYPTPFETTTTATTRPYIRRNKPLSTSCTVLIAHPFHSSTGGPSFASFSELMIFITIKLGKRSKEQEKEEQKELKQSAKSKNANNKREGLFASLLTKLRGKDTNGEGKRKKEKTINPVYAAIASNSVVSSYPLIFVERSLIITK